LIQGSSGEPEEEEAGGGKGREKIGREEEKEADIITDRYVLS
jgi:hypothetical protein